jgi:hypothetical protein
MSTHDLDAIQACIVEFNKHMRRFEARMNARPEPDEALWDLGLGLAALGRAVSTLTDEVRSEVKA